MCFVAITILHLIIHLIPMRYLCISSIVGYEMLEGKFHYVSQISRMENPYPLHLQKHGVGRWARAPVGELKKKDFTTTTSIPQ